jgi:hypothetical protein
MKPELPPGLTHIIGQVQLYTDEVEYVIVRLAPAQVNSALLMFSRMSVPFSAAVVDKDEITVLLPWESWLQVRDEIGVYDEARGYRLITFDIPTDLGLVGFIATISSQLAEAGIGILSVSAYTRDHILVQESDLDRALGVLEDFVQSCRE